MIQPHPPLRIAAALAAVRFLKHIVAPGDTDVSALAIGAFTAQPRQDRVCTGNLAILFAFTGTRHLRCRVTEEDFA